MSFIGVPELIVILLIVLILFGTSRLPQLGRGLGEGIRNFKRGLQEGDSSGTSERAPDSGKDDS